MHASNGTKQSGYASNGTKATGSSPSAYIQKPCSGPKSSTGRGFEVMPGGGIGGANKVKR